MEEIVLPLDVENVGVLGDDPEGIKPLGLRDCERGVLTQVREGRVDALLIGVGGWIDDGVGDVLRDHAGALLPTRFEQRAARRLIEVKRDVASGALPRRQKGWRRRESPLDGGLQHDKHISSRHAPHRCA